jgi:hypothetical protein
MTEYFIFTDKVMHIYRLSGTLSVYVHSSKIISGVTEDMIIDIQTEIVGCFRRHISYLPVSAEDFERLSLGFNTDRNAVTEGCGLTEYLGILTFENSCWSPCKKTKEVELFSTYSMDWQLVDGKFIENISKYEKKALENWLEFRRVNPV